MKVAIVHDWLTGMRGGEKVLEALCELFPEADLYTLLHVKGSVSRVIEDRRISSSFIERLPFASTAYRYYLPLFPAAVESFRLSGYDLVVSTSHCVAKGVVPPPGSLHISYIHTPMRYVWEMYDDYFGGRKGLSAAAARLVAHYLRLWDAATAPRVDSFVANSRHVAERVRRFYGREAHVIHPPVDCSKFALPPPSSRGLYYLVVSAFAPYKRVDLAIEAFNASGRRLLVAGSGQDEKRLRRMAGPSIEFVGWTDEGRLASLYQGCRALVFPGVEDFGITPLEAMASGRPVIALGRGGALETVVPPGAGGAPTGVFFMEQTAAALNRSVEELERLEPAFRPEAIRGRAMSFDRPLFKRRLREFIAMRYAQFKSGGGYAQKTQSAV